MCTSLILLVKMKGLERLVETEGSRFIIASLSPSFVSIVYRHVNLHVHVHMYVLQEYLAGICVGFEVMESYESPFHCMYM